MTQARHTYRIAAAAMKLQANNLRVVDKGLQVTIVPAFQASQVVECNCSQAGDAGTALITAHPLINIAKERFGFIQTPLAKALCP